MSQCAYCKQRKGKRPCPGLSGLICSQCCGEHRLVRVTCPSDCAYLDTGSDYQQKRLAVQFMPVRREFYRDLGEFGGAQAVSLFNLIEVITVSFFQGRRDGDVSFTLYQAVWPADVRGHAVLVRQAPGASPDGDVVTPPSTAPLAPADAAVFETFVVPRYLRHFGELANLCGRVQRAPLRRLRDGDDAWLGEMHIAPTDHSSGDLFGTQLPVLRRLHHEFGAEQPLGRTALIDVDVCGVGADDRFPALEEG